MVQRYRVPILALADALADRGKLTGDEVRVIFGIKGA